MKELSTLIVEANKYMKNPLTKVNTQLIISISQYILKITKCLGLVEIDPFGYNMQNEVQHSDVDIAPIIQTTLDFRDKIKKLAVIEDNKKPLFEE